ncbi:omega-scoloptoxin-Ssm1a, partial [Biomphalaria glabrata]
MNIDTAIWSFGILALLLKFVDGTILCSMCSSDQKPDCEINPPEPQPCPEVGSGLVKSCSIVRIINKSTGEQSMYIRSCATSTKSSGCVDTRPGFKTCATICYTDGCNASWSMHALSKTAFHLLYASLL